MKYRVLIRVDGSSTIGLGHVYRGIALADMLKADYQVTFLTRTAATLRPVRCAGYPVRNIAADSTLVDEPRWIAEHFSPPALMIMDGYHFDEDYQQKLKNAGFKTVYVDDLKQGHIYADLLINHAPHINAADYQTEEHTLLALGPHYAILRPVFLKLAQQQRQISQIDSALVCFGGGAQVPLVYQKTVQALLTCPQIKRISVVLGAACQDQQLAELPRTNSVALEIYQNLAPEQLASLMLSSNLALVPASTILYEVCAVKMPVVCGYSADNQEDVYHAMLAAAAVQGIGSWQAVTTQRLATAIQAVLRSDFARQMAVQSQLFDGGSKRRLLKLFERLVH